LYILFFFQLSLFLRVVFHHLFTAQTNKMAQNTHRAKRIKETKYQSKLTRSSLIVLYEEETVLFSRRSVRSVFLKLRQ